MSQLKLQSPDFFFFFFFVAIKFFLNKCFFFFFFFFFKALYNGDVQPLLHFRCAENFKLFVRRCKSCESQGPLARIEALLIFV